jgi:hypothetical protein
MMRKNSDGKYSIRLSCSDRNRFKRNDELYMSIIDYKRNAFGHRPANRPSSLPKSPNPHPIRLPPRPPVNPSRLPQPPLTPLPNLKRPHFPVTTNPLPPIQALRPIVRQRGLPIEDAVVDAGYRCDSGKDLVWAGGDARVL